MATRAPFYNGLRWPSHKEVRRCPTLPQGHPCSTIGAEGLSFRVRNVTGRFPFAMAAETLWIYSLLASLEAQLPTVNRELQSGREQHLKTHVLSSCRLISTGQLHGSLVPTSTSCLSTRSSSREPLPLRDGNLILKTASRLDAFSGYPVRT